MFVFACPLLVKVCPAESPLAQRLLSFRCTTSWRTASLKWKFNLWQRPATAQDCHDAILARLASLQEELRLDPIPLVAAVPQRSVRLYSCFCRYYLIFSAIVEAGCYGAVSSRASEPLTTLLEQLKATPRRRES